MTDPRPDQDSIGNYYLSNKYISHTGGNKSLFDKIYVEARRITLRSKRKIIGNNSAGTKILDFGCGTGEFLNEMKTHGFDPIGVEPSSIARTTAIKKTGLKIYSQISELKENSFDAITLWHVLEHVYDLNDTLEQLHGLLNETGTIFIAVPNRQSFDAKHYKEYWAAYDVPRHLWHFSKENIDAILKKNGFRITKTLPMRLDSFYVSLLSETYKHPDRLKFLHLINALIVGSKSNRIAQKKLEYSSHIYLAKR